MRTAYEASSARFTSFEFKDVILPSWNQSSVLVSSSTNATDFVTFFEGSFPSFRIIVGPNQTGNSTADARLHGWKFAWGFGDDPYNVPSHQFAGANAYDIIIRGYKYGLAGIFGSTVNATFRRDRYGQFRDMFEQRKYHATLNDDKTVEYPVQITFVSKQGERTTASKTHSQNLSQYATSSLPYYDGLAVERSDDPDVDLTPVEIEISLT